MRMTLADIALKKHGLVDGPFGSNLPASDYTLKGVPVIRGANLSVGKYRFNDNNYVFVSQETANRLNKCNCLPDDIIFTKKGTIGQVGIVPKNSSFKNFILSSNQMRMRLDRTIADPLFTYYYLSSPNISQKIIMEAMTTGVPKINLGYLKKFQIFFPSLNAQCKIASILSAYDELIENNNQRIRLLEEMAEEIYKEWFVRLRFPAYESTTFFDAEGRDVVHGTVGALPEGWKRVKLRDCFSHYIGGGWGDDAPKGKNCEPAYVIRGTDIPNTKIGNLNFDILRFHSSSNLSSRILQANDIVFEVSGGTESQSLGRAVLVSQSVIDRFNYDVICASFCKLIRLKQDLVSALFIYLLLNRLYATGEIMLFQVQSTGISNYKFEDFIERQKISIPTNSLQKEFDGIMQPILEEIQILGNKNQLLQQARDLLLPRLISGKLGVEHLIEEAESQSMAAEPTIAYETSK